MRGQQLDQRLQQGGADDPHGIIALQVKIKLGSASNTPEPQVSKDEPGQHADIEIEAHPQQSTGQPSAWKSGAASGLSVPGHSSGDEE